MDINITSKPVRHTHHLSIAEASGGFFVQLNPYTGIDKPTGEWVFSSNEELHNGLQTIAQMLAPVKRA